MQYLLCDFIVPQRRRKEKCAILHKRQKARLDRITERVGLSRLDKDIDSDIFPLARLEVVYTRGGFDKLAGVGFIHGQFGDF